MPAAKLVIEPFTAVKFVVPTVPAVTMPAVMLPAVTVPAAKLVIEPFTAVKFVVFTVPVLKLAAVKLVAPIVPAVMLPAVIVPALKLVYEALAEVTTAALITVKVPTVKALILPLVAVKFTIEAVPTVNESPVSQVLINEFAPCAVSPAATPLPFTTEKQVAVFTARAA